MITWTVSRDDARLIERIAARAVRDFEANGIRLDKMSAVMDITACHANGNPLDLAAFLAGEPFDFAHDIAGINRHINRGTGQLEDFFVPRFTARTLTT